MAFVRSRRNGLKIAIPPDARGVVHRFAISGGGNEFVFEPIEKKAYEESASTDKVPVQMGSPDKVEVPQAAAGSEVQLSLNVKEDEPEPEPKRKPRKKPTTDDII